MPEKLAKGARLTGPTRDKLAATLRRQYEDEGVSIRQIAAETGRSYGFVHRLLSESGVKLRGRGGATRRKRPEHPKPPQQAQPTHDQTQHQATPSFGGHGETAQAS